MREVKGTGVKADWVCSDCGLPWKDKSRKRWTCQERVAITGEEYGRVPTHNMLTGKQYRLGLEGVSVTWDSTDVEELVNHADKHGQIDGCQLAEAPPCPPIIDPADYLK